MKFLETTFEGLYVVELNKSGDDRGWFMRTYCETEFAKIGFNNHWVQHNHSFTRFKGTIRGMHYQLPPYGEIKLVRCIAGKVFDCVIDLRTNSSTYLKWFSIELSAKSSNMLLIPQGFAHGFQTLEDDCELFYCHSEFYNPSAESGILFSDKMITITWPLPVTEISQRDLNHQIINDNFKGYNNFL